MLSSLWLDWGGVPLGLRSRLPTVAGAVVEAVEEKSERRCPKSQLLK